MARCYIRGRLQACHYPARFASCGENQQVDLYTGRPVFGKPALKTAHPATSCFPAPGSNHCKAAFSDRAGEGGGFSRPLG
jgi:hypothetical protein